MVVTVIFIILSILVIGGTAVYLKMYSPEAQHKRKTQTNATVAADDNTDNQKSVIKKNELTEIKRMWGIEDIRNGIIHLSNNRYRRILALGSLDFYLLSQAEQEVVENQLMQTAMSLQFPVQFITTTERVDTQQTIKEIDELIAKDDGNDKLNLYAQKMKQYLINMMEDKGVYVRRSYAIICSNEQYTQEKGIEALDRYTGTLMSTLSRAKISTAPLTTKDIINLLYREINKESPIVPSNIIDEGSMEMYATGLGVVGEIDIGEVEEQHNPEQNTDTGR